MVEDLRLEEDVPLGDVPVVVAVRRDHLMVGRVGISGVSRVGRGYADMAGVCMYDEAARVARLRRRRQERGIRTTRQDCRRTLGRLTATL